MPASAILAPNTAAGQSTTVTVTAATPATLSAFVAAGTGLDSEVSIPIEKLNSSGNWGPTGQNLTGGANPGNGAPGNPVVISAPGQYRVNKPITRQAIGIDLDQ